MDEIFGRWQYLVVISLRRMVSRGNQPKFSAFGPVKYVVTDVDMKLDMTGHHGMQYISIIAILFSKLLTIIDVWMCLA